MSPDDRPRLKTLPQNPSLEVQRQMLFQPETNPTNYMPFENADRHPFEPAPDGPSRVNAWWLAEASWLSYWRDADKMREVLRSAGLATFESIAGGGTQGYLAANDRFAIVAFRGTQSDEFRDLFDDVRFAARKWDVGHVHEGFAGALDVVRAPLEAALAKAPAGLPVWFTGHSLGAAVATLAAFRHRDRRGGVYTFGCPFLGNGVFATELDTAFSGRSLRFVNDHDVVTRVPPPPFALPHGQYTHVQELRAIDRDGHVGTPPEPSGFFRDIFGDTGVMLDMVRLSQEGANLRLPDALSDHTPLYYVIHCWNDFVTSTLT